MEGRAPQSAWAIAEALGRIGDPRSVEPLMKMLEGNSDGAASAAKGLGLLVGRNREAARKAVPLLCQRLLECRYSTVRIHAADALGAIGDPAAVPALARALSDEQEEVWGRAAIALGRIGRADPAALTALRERVAAEPRSWEVWARAAAEEALGKLSKPGGADGGPRAR
jgi:HEAT repeat protein